MIVSATDRRTLRHPFSDHRVVGRALFELSGAAAYGLAKTTGQRGPRAKTSPRDMTMEAAPKARAWNFVRRGVCCRLDGGTGSAD
jgi:hypothetical protein